MTKTQQVNIWSSLCDIDCSGGVTSTVPCSAISGTPCTESDPATHCPASVAFSNLDASFHGPFALIPSASKPVLCRWRHQVPTDWTVAWASWTTAVAPPECSNFIYLILFIGQGYDFFFYFYCRNPANGITIIAFQDILGATNTFQTADMQWYEFMYKSMKQPARTNHMWNPVASITIERNRGICTLFYFLLGNVSVGPPQLCRSPEGLGRPQFSHTPLSLKPLTQTFQKPKLFFVVLCSFCALPQGKFH